MCQKFGNAAFGVTIVGGIKLGGINLKKKKKESGTPSLCVLLKMQAVKFAALNPAADVHDPLPPPTRFRKDSAQQSVGEEERRLIWAYTQKYRRQTIQVELSCSSSLPSSPSANEWKKIYRSLKLQVPEFLSKTDV